MKLLPSTQLVLNQSQVKGQPYRRIRGRPRGSTSPAFVELTTELRVGSSFSPENYWDLSQATGHRTGNWPRHDLLQATFPGHDEANGCFLSCFCIVTTVIILKVDILIAAQWFQPVANGSGHYRGTVATTEREAAVRSWLHQSC